MVCFICQLPVDAWGHVVSMLSLKQLARLDSAAAGGSTRTVLHDSIFPRSPGQSFPAGAKQTAVLWCLHHDVPIEHLGLRCTEEEVRLLEALALHGRLIRHVSLRCAKRERLLRALNKRNLHALNDLISLSLVCEPDFDLSDEGGFSEEEQGICRRLRTLWFKGRQGGHNPDATAWLTACLEHSSTLNTVKLWDMRNLTTEVFWTTAFRSSNFTALTLRRCNLTDPMALHIAEFCKQLRNLSIHENATTVAHTEHPGADTENLLSDSGLIAIAKGCKFMAVLDLDHKSDNTAILEAFAMHCAHLRRAYAPLCALSAAALNTLATRCPSLTSLSVTWVVAPEECVVAEELPKLESLTVKVDSTRTAGCAMALQSIARVCSALRLIELDGSWLEPSTQYSVIGAALVALARANPNMTDFTLRGLDCDLLALDHLVSVAQCWSKLNSLYSTSGLADAALTAFAQHCSGLMDVWIRGAYPPITDHGVLMLAQHCPKLSFVDLPHANQVTEEAFTELVRCCPQLESLVVPPTFSQEAMKRIAAANSRRNVYVYHPHQ